MWRRGSGWSGTAGRGGRGRDERRKEKGEEVEKGLGRRNRTTYGKRMMEMMRIMMEKEEGDKVRKRRRE